MFMRLVAMGLSKRKVSPERTGLDRLSYLLRLEAATTCQRRARLGRDKKQEMQKRKNWMNGTMPIRKVADCTDFGKGQENLQHRLFT